MGSCSVALPLSLGGLNWNSPKKLVSCGQAPQINDRTGEGGPQPESSRAPHLASCRSFAKARALRERPPWCVSSRSDKAKHFLNSTPRWCCKTSSSGPRQRGDPKPIVLDLRLNVGHRGGSPGVLIPNVGSVPLSPRPRSPSGPRQASTATHHDAAHRCEVMPDGFADGARVCCRRA